MTWRARLWLIVVSTVIITVALALAYSPTVEPRTEPGFIVTSPDEWTWSVMLDNGRQVRFTCAELAAPVLPAEFHWIRSEPEYLKACVERVPIWVDGRLNGPR